YCGPLTMCTRLSCQAEDGIRYRSVTGVQTCALPIFSVGSGFCWSSCPMMAPKAIRSPTMTTNAKQPFATVDVGFFGLTPQFGHRSEERRVGKECRSRWET